MGVTASLMRPYSGKGWKTVVLRQREAGLKLLVVMSPRVSG